ncbi:MAG: GNAT family N-acetyltransferase [Paracoccaceae bacterium]
MSQTMTPGGPLVSETLAIRRAEPADMAQVSALDALVTGTAKPKYWGDIFERYAMRRLDERFFLIAEGETDRPENPVLGYIVGEIRGWEFGSEPCGWVFAFAVDPETRQQGVGEHLFQALTEAFRQAGMSVMRTMVPRQNRLHMAFFRSEGMVAGPYIELELDLDDETG